jgi:hypothetical protein
MSLCVIPAKAGIQTKSWIPAFAGMTMNQAGGNRSGIER